MKRKCIGIIVPIFVLVLFLPFSGYSGIKTDDDRSPVLKDAVIRTYNNGTEDSQFVEVSLEFDKPIRLRDDPGDNMQITIAEERMEPEAFAADGNNLRFRIPVTAITRGNLRIQEKKEGKGYPGITDRQGEYHIMPFAVDMLVPSGITLRDVSGYTGKGFRKKVEGRWNIRNITWLRLTEDGAAAVSQIDTYLDNMGDAVALHGHDFLIYDSSMIAEEMAETLNRHFGSRYIFRSEGGEIIGERIDGSLDTKLDLEIYEYKHITKKVSQEKNG